MRATVCAPETGAPVKPREKWVSNKWRLFCLALTIAALFLVFRKIPVRNLFETIRSMRVSWFLGSVAVYGLLFLPASWRWQLALRVSDSVVSVPATIRFSIIGHFFYLLLFGGAGGDTAKAVAYSRRYDFPLPKILASVSLDRLMGSGALIVVAGLAFAIAGTHGAFSGT